MRSMRFHFKCTSIDFSMRTKCKVITMSLPITCWIAFLYIYQIYPTNNYLIEVENWNNRTLHEICSEVTTKTSERHLSSILLTWDFKHCSVVSTVNSVQANASWIYNKEFQKKKSPFCKNTLHVRALNHCSCTTFHFFSKIKFDRYSTTPTPTYKLKWSNTILR